MRGKAVLVSTLAFCLVFTGVAVGAKKSGATAVPSIDREDILQRQTTSRDPGASTLAKAEEHVAYAQGLIEQGELVGATGILHKVVQMELPESRVADKLLAQANLLLGDAYLEVYASNAAAAVKSAGYYNIAVSHLNIDEDFGLILETVRRTAAIYHTIGDTEHATTLDGIVKDLESGLRPSLDLMPFTVALGATTRDAGDDTCDAAVDASLPWNETMSVSPSGDHNWRSYSLSETSLVRIETLSADTFGDDTDLNLYGGCAGGAPSDFIEFDDDDGPGFLSLIEVCQPAGDYWVEVGGWNNTATPDDFGFSIAVLDTCVIPAPDEYEPDNESSQATKIGFRNNGVGEGNQNGRDNSQIQSHSIFAAGDVDFVKFGLSRANRVRMETSGAGDTLIGFSNIGGQLLAVDDDGGDGLSSKLEFCLPGSSDWFLAIVPFSGTATFPYDIAVDVESPCNFEEEPNGVCGQANDIAPGEVYSGLQTAAGVAENDYWTFTLDTPQFVTIETDGWDDFDVDTYLELYDGCPGTLLAADDDAGDGFLSRIDIQLDAGTYYINATVSPFSVGANYPYDIQVTFTEPPLTETEPNNSCGTANAAFLGDNFLSSIGPVGDRDHYLLSVPSDGFVQVETDGPSGDTVLQIESADGSTVIGCDDDGGTGLFSLFGCCLPAGDYCVAVRDFGDNSTISSYNIEFSDLGACTPSDPPVCSVAGLGCPF